MVAPSHPIRLSADCCCMLSVCCRRRHARSEEGSRRGPSGGAARIGRVECWCCLCCGSAIFAESPYSLMNPGPPRWQTFNSPHLHGSRTHLHTGVPGARGPCLRRHSNSIISGSPGATDTGHYLASGSRRGWGLNWGSFLLEGAVADISSHHALHWTSSTMAALIGWAPVLVRGPPPDATDEPPSWSLLPSLAARPAGRRGPHGRGQVRPLAGAAGASPARAGSSCTPPPPTGAPLTLLSRCGG